MKTLLLIVYVVVEVLTAGLVLVGIWRISGIGNTPQGRWVAAGVFLVVLVVDLLFHWLGARGYQFSDSDMHHNGTRPWGAFGVGMYLSRKPGGPPEVPFTGPRKFPDGDY